MPIRKDTEPRLLRYIYTGRRETQLGIEFHMRSGAAFQREGAGSFGRRLRHSGITVFVPQNGENGSGQCFRLTRRHEQAIDVRRHTLSAPPHLRGDHGERGHRRFHEPTRPPFNSRALPHPPPSPHHSPPPHPPPTTPPPPPPPPP